MREKTVEQIIIGFVVGLIIIVASYSLIGSEGDVAMIKQLAPASIEARGWEILRYEGYQKGSWGNHGGKVWYHVRDVNNHTIQYRVYITEWHDELHYSYGAPERLQRIEINHENR